MQSWEITFRKGFAPNMSDAHIKALYEAVESDSVDLLQGETTKPPPLVEVADWPCEGGCAVSLAGWRGDGLETVGHVEEHFARMCFEADQSLGEPAGCRWFLNWFDETPRDEMRRELKRVLEDVMNERGITVGA